MKLVLTISMALAATYLGLIAALLAARPKGNLLGEAVRLLPDLLRLLRRLAGDSRLPRADRVRLALLLGYLVLPIDLVPDFVPVLGYADDAILVSLVLRSVVRRAGAPVVRRHWPGTDDGLAALARVTGLEPLSQNATAPPDLARRASMTPAGRDHPTSTPTRHGRGPSQPLSLWRIPESIGPTQIGYCNRLTARAARNQLLVSHALREPPLTGVLALPRGASTARPRRSPVGCPGDAGRAARESPWAHHAFV
jgi:uncharacterized membrane protein YkvA (DUF1232 family)